MGKWSEKFSYVNIIFFVIFGVLTGVLWAYGSPIPLVPGAIHLRTFAFIIVVIAFLFGPVTGFFAGYIGTVVWALIGGYFIPLHTPLVDGITVGLSAALPAYVMMRNNKSLEEITADKKSFIIKCMFWSVLFCIAMVFATSASLAYFAGLDYWFSVLWIGIADVVPVAITPFVVLLLAPRIKRIQTIIPWV